MIIKIIMLSGGYDSTGLLFWALSHPEWIVCAHHMILVNREQRHEPEIKSVNEIEKYIDKNNIQCEITSSRIEQVDKWYCGKDIVHAALMGAIAASGEFMRHRRSRPQIDVFTGGTMEDDFNTQLENRDGIWKKHKIFETYFADWPKHWPVPTISAPLMKEYKKDVVKYIPKELLPHLFTCRIPKKDGEIFLECGKCVSCERKKNLFDTSQ